MENRLLRFDFVPEETYCARLGDDGKKHGFPSHKAWIIAIDGKEEPFGPHCAGEILGHTAFLAAKHSVPDLTTHDMSKADAKGAGVAAGNGGGGAGTADEGSRRHSLAAAYLHLRGVALASLPGINAGVAGFGPLAKLHEDYRSANVLTHEQVEEVFRLEAAAREKAWVFSHTHLLDVYTAHHQLLRKRAETAKKLTAMKKKPWSDPAKHASRETSLTGRLDTIDSVHRQLLSKLNLSEKQIAMLKLELRPGAFPQEKYKPHRA